MTRTAVFSIMSVLALGLLISSCDRLSGADPTETKGLYVKFMNSTGSEFTVTDIQLMPMGNAGADQSTPSGEWSENILTDGDTLAPGEHRFFTLDIPGGHWSQYRLGVYDTSGNRIMLHEQQGYPESAMLGSITHWGSDERSVVATVTRNAATGLISISGYSDWAGIE